MNVLFLSLGKLDDIEERSMYTDLLRQFKENGHNLYVVSSRERRTKKKTEYIVEKDVHFLRVKIGNIKKTNIIEKGISTLRIEDLFLKEIKKHFSNIKFDLILYTTPPITFVKIINYIKKKDGAKSYLMLKDIFPQNAVDLEMFSKKSMLYKYFRRKERKLYNSSDFIGCMSEANVEYLLKNNPELTQKTIEVCPNSIEPVYKNKNAETKFEIRKKYNIPLNSTVFIYGGSLGKPQGIDYLIECIDSNVNNKEAFFIIVGSGTEYRKLQNYFSESKPPNALLFEKLPKTEYEILADSCDVGLIFLNKKFTIPNFPSRLLSYMQASMPVLAATDISTDLGKIIEKGEFGYWCETGDLMKFNERIKELANTQIKVQMGKKSREYLENNYTAEHTYKIIIKHFS